MLKLFAALLAAWAVLLLVAGGVCLTGGVLPSGQAMSLDRAAFTAVNAATLTGFRQSIADVGQYRPAGQIAAFTAMLGGIALSWTVGGVAVGRLAGVPVRPGPLLGWTAAALAALALLAAALNGWAGAFAAVASFGNCGLTLEATRTARGAGPQILLLIAAVGGLGPVAVMGWRGRRFTPYAPAALAATAGIYLVGTALLLPAFLPESSAEAFSAKPQAAGVALGPALADASAASLDARTVGTDLGLVGRSRAADWSILVLMAIGAGPGGTGVGLGPAALALLALAATAALRRESGRGIDRESDRPAGSFHPALRRPAAVAGLWAAAYLGLALIGQGVLLTLQPQLPGDRALFLTVSALSNAGLSPDPISATGPGLWTLTALMLLGRLAPLALLTWAARAAAPAAPNETPRPATEAGRGGTS